MADNLTIKDSASNTKTIGTKDLSGVHLPKTVPVDLAGNPIEGVAGETLVVNESNFVSEYLLNAASNDMGVKGDVAAVTFNYSPAAGKKLIHGRVILYLEMSGNFDSVKFGDLAALANGVSITANGTEIENWKDNIDIGVTAFDHKAGDVFTKTTKAMLVRWTFWKVAGQVQGLEILEANGFSFIIQDDLSAAGIIFRAKVQGVLVDV